MAERQTSSIPNTSDSKSDRDAVFSFLDKLAEEFKWELTEDQHEPWKTALKKEADAFVPRVEECGLLPFVREAFREYHEKRFNIHDLFRKVTRKFAEEHRLALIVHFSDFMPPSWKFNFRSNTDLKAKGEVSVQFHKGGKFELIYSWSGANSAMVDW